MASPHILGVLLVFAGLALFLLPFFLELEVSVSTVRWTGIGAIIAGLLITSAYEGTAINGTNETFREYFAFGGFSFGNWQTLPPIAQIKLIERTDTFTNTSNGISPTLSGKVTRYMIFIYTKDTDGPLFSFEFAQKEVALSKAQYLATQLDTTFTSNMAE